MSPTYTSAIVIVIVSVLGLFKIKIGTEELTAIVAPLITGILGIIVLVRRFKKGDLTLSGFRKKND